MSARGSSSSDFPERFQAKACPGRSASAFRRVFDALVSAFTRVFDALWGGAPQARTQNRENNPMQSRIGPTRRRRAAVRPGHERKWTAVAAQPNLNPLQRLENQERPLDPGGRFSFVSFACR